VSRTGAGAHFRLTLPSGAVAAGPLEPRAQREAETRGG
jgi:hypothetical protein